MLNAYYLLEQLNFFMSSELYYPMEPENIRALRL